MRVSTNLLKQFGEITKNDSEITKLIEEHIGEVDYSHNLSDDYKDIVVAEITDKKEHPDADKLGIYMVNYGEKDSIQVVAGDKTLNIGDKVAYMKIGAVVPYTILTEDVPLEIKKINLRGITSNGMMGSERELNLGNNHDKVLVLPNDAPVGKSFAEYHHLNDTVIEIENKALTNRGDLFGILGISRELTAIVGNKFESPNWYLKSEKDLKPKNVCLNIKITNDAEAICHRYTAIALNNIKVKESPIWLKSDLIKCGIKPINNIVDITNYISLLIGQPLHAFDFDKLVKNDPNSKDTANIKIRMATAEEKILGLDDKLYELDESIMVIADSTHPIAIAGVIGGKDTEVDEKTTRIILESANFNKTSIRKTSMKLGLFTEAATRFKHDLDPKQCIPALLKAVEMIQEEGSADIASKIVDIFHEESSTKTISIDKENVNSVLGTNLTLDDIKNILMNLEYRVEKRKGLENLKKENTLYVTAPSWRKDIQMKEDIYEDIGRIYGFNNIKVDLPLKRITPPAVNSIVNLKSKIRQILSNSGANELITYNFVSPDSFEKCNLDSNLAYKIRNPISPELSLMRTTLIQSLLSKARENIEKGQDRFVIYEMNVAHLNNYIHEDKLPIEHWYLSLLLNDSSLKSDTSAYYSTSQYLKKILSTIGIHNIQYELLSESEEINLHSHIKNILELFDANRSSIITAEGVKLGIMGELKENVKENYKLGQYSSALEINLDELTRIKPKNKKYSEQSIYPPFTKDICFEVEVGQRYIEIEREIIQILDKGNLWNRVGCLDIYRDPKVDDKKRITYRITASSFDRTLTEKDISSLLSKISKKVGEKFNASVI